MVEPGKGIGVIKHYYDRLQVGIIQLNAPLKIGDTIHVKGAHDDFIQMIDSIQIEHQKIDEANAGDLVGIKLNQKVHEHDVVYRAE